MQERVEEQLPRAIAAVEEEVSRLQEDHSIIGEWGDREREMVALVMGLCVCVCAEMQTAASIEKSKELEVGVVYVSHLSHSPYYSPSFSLPLPPSHSLPLVSLSSYMYLCRIRYATSQ